MKKASEIREDIEKYNLESEADAACKELLAHTIFLAWILKSVMPEFASYDVNTIASRFIEAEAIEISSTPVERDVPSASLDRKIVGLTNEDTTRLEGTVRFDILFPVHIPGTTELCTLIVNIEAQGRTRIGYPILKRAVYYAARLLSRQKGRGQFVHSHYEALKKVVTIWICLHPAAETDNTINAYQMQEKHLAGDLVMPPEDYDLEEVILINLGDLHSPACKGILRLLTVLLSDKIDVQSKERILHQDFDIQMTREMKEEATSMCTYSEGIKEIAWEEGRLEGKQEGMAQLLEIYMEQNKTDLHEAMAFFRFPESDFELFAGLIAENRKPASK